MNVYARACARVCVTGVQRGPARGTEFKFQIWSVSQGVTVCIALLASSNSLRASSVLVPPPAPFTTTAFTTPAAHCAPDFPSLFLESTRCVRPTIPLHSFLIYPSIAIFHIIRATEESNLIDRARARACACVYLLETFTNSTCFSPLSTRSRALVFSKNVSDPSTLRNAR